MRPEDLKSGGTADAEAVVTTNLLGPMRLTAALLPHLLAQPRATVMTVSSGLAFVPMAMTSTYCATKAAIHSYTQSLRYQLRGTSVQVLELIPPYVQTHLMGARQANRSQRDALGGFHYRSHEHPEEFTGCNRDMRGAGQAIALRRAQQRLRSFLYPLQRCHNGGFALAMATYKARSRSGPCCWD